MTDEHQEKFVMGALNHFCTYLNHWWDSEEINKGEKSPYTIEKFTITNYDKGLYGETNWKVLEDINDELAFPTGLIQIITSDGDEGGGNILYVGLQGHFTEPMDVQISWIVHIFDLTSYMIYSDENGYRTWPNGEMKALT